MIWTKKIIPIFILGSLFALVIWQVPPPISLSESSPFLLLAFFLPLTLLLVYLANLYLKSFCKSLAVSLSLISLLILQGLDWLNIATFLGVGLGLYLIFKYFKKPTSFSREIKPLPQLKFKRLSRLDKQK